MDIAGKVTIVTGTASGIGLATARRFTQHGAKVALAARSVAKLQRVAAELPGSFVVPTNMRDSNTVHQHYGRIDILINHAENSIGLPTPQRGAKSAMRLWPVSPPQAVAEKF